MDFLKKENKLLKKAVLDVQSRIMRDNLIFSGVPENTQEDNPEAQVKKFMETALQIPTATVNNSSIHPKEVSALVASLSNSSIFSKKI